MIYQIVIITKTFKSSIIPLELDAIIQLIFSKFYESKLNCIKKRQRKVKLGKNRKERERKKKMMII